VEQLMPCEGKDSEAPKSVLVTSASAWCHELVKWVKEKREEHSEDDSDELGRASIMSGGHHVKPWLPYLLPYTLFMGKSKQLPPAI
jgi:hypothetical protein